MTSAIQVDDVINVVRQQIQREVGSMLSAFTPAEVTTAELISMAVLLRPIAQRVEAKRRKPQKPTLTVVSNAGSVR
ncbi:hypothetical protein [Mycolicibacterium cosmeticum]|uniref:hypothetical protein n=1 Tax=Mycolicibacterium cosmeticum TaxID=258533 RepID=UPI003204B63D